MDDIPAKIAFISLCLSPRDSFLISLGMANRLDPSQVTLCRLDKTEGDPLSEETPE
jgi:tRNA A37 threonylcarbamoyladenosine dehydratase